MSVTPWIPSHQDLARHPKTRKAARRADVSLPTMIGHLHLLWYWALDLAPDGDLSKFDDEDLADAAMWEGDPETFVAALIDCGPGDQDGFLDPDHRLHDWDQYGGKYRKRVEAGRKGAEARWSDAPAEEPTPDGSAVSEPPDSDRNATAMPPHSDTNGDRNAEERRGEEKDLTLVAPDGDDEKVDPVEEQFNEFWFAYPRGPAGKPGGDGSRKIAFQKWRRLKQPERDACMAAVGNYRQHIEHPDSPNAAHVVTWLNQERWEIWQEPAETSPVNDDPLGLRQVPG